MSHGNNRAAGRTRKVAEFENFKPLQSSQVLEDGWIAEVTLDVVGIEHEHLHAKAHCPQEFVVPASLATMHSLQCRRRAVGHTPADSSGLRPGS